jgi:hypothetical protein
MPIKLYYSIQGSLFKLIQSVIYTAILFGITTASNVIVIMQILLRQIQIYLSRVTCSKFRNYGKYFVSKLLYYIENITIFLPGCYSVIPDVRSSLKYVIFI